MSPAVARRPDDPAGASSGRAVRRWERRRRRRRWVLVALAVAVLLTLLVTVYFARRDTPPPVPSAASQGRLQQTLFAQPRGEGGARLRGADVVVVVGADGAPGAGPSSSGPASPRPG